MITGSDTHHNDYTSAHEVAMGDYYAPTTGGPGTKLIYFLGIILTSLACTGFMMRKRYKTW